LDSTERFWLAWTKHDLPLPITAVRSEDLYEAYRHFCHRQGISKPATLATFSGNCSKRPGAVRRQRRYYQAGTQTARQGIFLSPDEVDDGAVSIGTLTEQGQSFREAVKAWRDDKEYIRGIA